MVKNPYRRAIVLVALILAVSAACTVALAKRHSLPITIAFSPSIPPTKIHVFQVCHLTVRWNNLDSENSYTGNMLLIVTGNKLTSSDLTVNYQGSLIIPEKWGNRLCYCMPEQLFKAEKSGIIGLDLTINSPGVYEWTLGIVQR